MTGDTSSPRGIDSTRSASAILLRITLWTTPVVGAIIVLAGIFDLSDGEYLSALGRAGILLLLGFSWFQVRARVRRPLARRGQAD